MTEYRIIRLRREIVFQDEMTLEEAQEQMRLYHQAEVDDGIDDSFFGIEEVKE